MTQPSFAALADALTAFTHRPLTDPARLSGNKLKTLLEIILAADSAGTPLVGLWRPCRRDYWSLYYRASQMQTARVYAPPNLYAPQLPRTH